MNCRCPDDEVPCTDPATQEDLLCHHCRRYCETGGLISGVGRVTRSDAGGGTGGQKLRGNPQTGDADAPTTLMSPPARIGCDR